MERTYWHKQGIEPLYPDLVWSRPENKAHAGKLLIVGGNTHGFAAPAETFNLAQKAGAGTIRVLLPDATRKIVGRFLDVGEYLPSTPSGSFARTALTEIIASSVWADAVLFAGDLGHNSETAIVLESFLQKTDSLTVLGKDAADSLYASPLPALMRQNTTIVVSFAQLQRLLTGANSAQNLAYNMDLLHLVDALHTLSTTYKASLITKHNDTVFVASGGQVSSTKVDEEIWRVKAAAYAAVWQMQNPTRPFESLTTAIADLCQTHK